MKNVQKLRKIGKEEVCMVIRADEEGGYIDLSKKRVPSQIAAFEEKYQKGKQVQAMMRAVVEKTGSDLHDLYKTIVWPLQKRFPHALDAFQEALG
jgi:translation initiation factor 2 subunit 1